MKKLLIAIPLLLICCNAQALEINLSVIAEIESSNNPLAKGDCFEDVCKSLGLLQLQEGVIKEYNLSHRSRYTHSDALQPITARKIGFWYFHARIPEMLSHYRISDTLENRIQCYNQGIGSLVYKKKRSRITARYLKLYKLLNKK